MPGVATRDGAQARVEQYQSTGAATYPLVVDVWIDVYGRSPADTPELLRSQHYDSVLIDPLSRERVNRSAVSAAEFDDLSADADRREVRLSVHEGQLGPLLDREHKVVAVLSGSRAGKSEMMSTWLVLQWVDRGYDGALFWWVAPTVRQAWILVQKLLVSREGGLPPILPRDLVLSYPASSTKHDQIVEFLDGSCIELFHAHGDGDNLKGFGVEAVAIDEICSVKRIENYRVALARTLKSGGQLAVVSTPKKNHWAKAEIHDVSLQPDSHVRSDRFTCYDNPWMPRAEVRRLIETMGGDADPVVRQEIYGEWSLQGAAAFPDYDPQRHLRVEPHYDVSGWGLANITGQAIQGHWRGPAHTCFGGQDFNARSHTTLVMQVAGDPADWQSWAVYVLAEYQFAGVLEQHAAELVAALRRDFRADPCPLACDATGSHLENSRAHTESTARSYSSVKVLGHYGFDAKAPDFVRGTPRNPPQRDTLQLCSWLLRRNKLLVHERCRVLRRGMQELECKDDGTIAKVSAPGSVTDILSDPVDCLRYGVWAIFGRIWIKHLRQQRPATHALHDRPAASH